MMLTVFEKSRQIYHVVHVTSWRLRFISREGLAEKINFLVNSIPFRGSELFSKPTRPYCPRPTIYKYLIDIDMIIKTFFFKLLVQVGMLKCNRTSLLGGMCSNSRTYTKRKSGSQLPLTLLVHKYKEMDRPHK